jgi:hypothetical protein
MSIHRKTRETTLAIIGVDYFLLSLVVFRVLCISSRCNNTPVVLPLLSSSLA